MKNTISHRVADFLKNFPPFTFLQQKEIETLSEQISIIYKEKLPTEGIIVMGNEANGISKPIENLVSKRITIPRFGDLQATESLNVATATAIILSEFKR